MQRAHFGLGGIRRLWQWGLRGQRGIANRVWSGDMLPCDVGTLMREHSFCAFLLRIARACADA